MTSAPFSNPRMIRVSYSCPVCKIVDRKILVPRRDPAVTHISRWLDNVIGLISTDHTTRSPGCHVTELHDLRIAPEGIAWIGTFPVDPSVTS